MIVWGNSHRTPRDHRDDRAPEYRPRRFLHNQLEQASQDLLRQLLTALIDTLMSAEADAVRGAAYKSRRLERATTRKGYRPRNSDTRADTLEVTIPDLRTSSYFPDGEAWSPWAIPPCRSRGQRDCQRPRRPRRRVPDPPVGLGAQTLVDADADAFVLKGVRAAAPLGVTPYRHRVDTDRHRKVLGLQTSSGKLIAARGRTRTTRIRTPSRLIMVWGGPAAG